MSPDRLEILRRQRALLAQHLAWLDSEIAGLEVFSPTRTASAPGSAPPLPVASREPSRPEAAQDAADLEFSRLSPATSERQPLPAAVEPEDPNLADANARADAILEQYAATGRFNPESTRRGCLLFAIAVLLIGIAGLLAVYLVRYR